MPKGLKEKIASAVKNQVRTNLPDFKPGDTLRVHAKVVEGTKERIQVFEGVVVKRHRGIQPEASFTVRKVSYNIGVERTFLLHSPRIDRIEVVSRGVARRARLYHLRPLRGKAAKIKTRFLNDEELAQLEEQNALSEKGSASAASAEKAAGKSSEKKSKDAGETGLDAAASSSAV